MILFILVFILFFIVFLLNNKKNKNYFKIGVCICLVFLGVYFLSIPKYLYPLYLPPKKLYNIDTYTNNTYTNNTYTRHTRHNKIDTQLSKIPLWEELRTQTILKIVDSQKQMFCGIHALNNLFQKIWLNADISKKVCLYLQDKKYAGKYSVSSKPNGDFCSLDGNFSSDVLEYIINYYTNKNYIGIPFTMYFKELKEEDIPLSFREYDIFSQDPENGCVGFILSNGNHWIAYRNIYSKQKQQIVVLDSMDNIPGPVLETFQQVFQHIYQFCQTSRQMACLFICLNQPKRIESFLEKSGLIQIEIDG